MKIFKGIVKKVPTDDHFKAYEQGLIEMSELKLIDTIRKYEGENGEFELLPIKLSYQEIDQNGNDKFIFDPDADVYIKSYKSTPTLYAKGKEMRILIELGEYTPVKIAVSEEIKEEKKYYRIVCIQNQHSGME